MWIAFYNEQGVGDVLMLTRGKQTRIIYQQNQIMV